MRSSLEALRVPLVRYLASALGAAVGTSPSRTTTSGERRRISLKQTSTANRLERDSLSEESSTGSRVTSARGGRSASRWARSTGATATPDGGSRPRNRLVPIVDAEVGVGVGRFVGAREASHGAWGAGPTAGDLDLHARHVVLGLVNVGAVNTCTRYQTTDIFGTKNQLGRTYRRARSGQGTRRWGCFWG